MECTHLPTHHQPRLHGYKVHVCEKKKKKKKEEEEEEEDWAQLIKSLFNYGLIAH